MSLALAAHAITGIHATPFRLVTRQEGTANANNTTLDMPDFTCTLRQPNPVGLNEKPPYLRACEGSPAIFKPLDACYSAASDDDPPQFYYSNCVEHCNNLQNGTYIPELNKCWAQECTDHDEEKNRAMLEYVRDSEIKKICEPIGLIGGNNLRYDEMFYCTLKPDQMNYRDGKHRPEDQPFCNESLVAETAMKCMAPPTEEEKAAGRYKPRGRGREECAEYCEIANNGTMLEEMWKCWDTGCTDAREGKNEAMNDKYFKDTVEGVIINVCEPLGLAQDGTAKGGEGKEEAKGDDKPKDSAANGSGLGTKKGVVVLAVVFGTLFSAYL